MTAPCQRIGSSYQTWPDYMTAKQEEFQKMKKLIQAMISGSHVRLGLTGVLPTGTGRVAGVTIVMGWISRSGLRLCPRA
jgi:hypothetical protein